MILCEGVAELIHTVGWRHCLSGRGRCLSLTRLFRIRMAGYAINYVTPTAALGGEVTKAVLLASNQRGAEAVSGVLIGKICFALGHLLFVAVGTLVILWRIKLPQSLWVGMLVSSALLAGGMVTFCCFRRTANRGADPWWRRARSGGRALQRLAADITGVDEALKVYYRERPMDLGLAVGWHLLGFSVGIFQTWFFFRLLNKDVSLAVTAGTWFLGMWFDLLTFAVPMNLGALEEPGRGAQSHRL